MADLNANPIRFENGGTLTLDSDNILHIIAGTLRFTECAYKNIPFSDRGIPQAPRDGDLEPGQFELEARVGSHVTTDLRAAVQTAGSGGLAKQWTAVAKFPTARGGAAGVQYTFATLTFDREQTEFRAGTEFDTVRVRGTYITAGPTKATY